MLARASSDAGTRLRRSKSNSTVHRAAPPLIEALDPDVAQQHAIAAATAAFARSHAQEALECKTNRSVELSRSKSTTSRKSLTSQGSHFPPRELSVRSVPAQKSLQMSRFHRLSAASATEKFPLFDPASVSERPLSAARPLSAQPSITLSEYAQPACQLKSHRQSAASSITSQQIRKARSMYYASSVQTGSPIARPPAKYLTTPPPVSTSPALGTTPVAYVPTRSTGPSSLARPKVTVAVSPDKAIDTARDKYMKDFQQQPRSIKHKPSLFLAPFKKRQDKSKDNYKRVSSTGTSNYSFVDNTVADITVNDFVPQAEVKDRRSFSGSLKRKIKRVFRRSSVKSPSLPVQQIEASREYFNDTTVQSTGDHGDIPSPEEHLLRRVRSRTPPLDALHPHVTRSASRSSSRGSTRSNRSLHSEANASHASTSRVTSWGTSASGETLTQRAIKRLTIIHEAQDSIGSTTDRPLSASTKRRSLPLSNFAAFKDPMHMESLTEKASTPPVDPKRVFSALMREIDASKVAESSADQRTPGAESDVFESSMTKELHGNRERPPSSAKKDSDLLHSHEKEGATYRPASVAARSVQSKKSSIKSFGQVIRSTTRTVTPGEHRSSPDPDGRGATQSNSDTPSSGTSSGSRGDPESRAALFNRLRMSKKKGPSLTQDTSAETATPAATQIDMRVAKAKSRWQTPLNETSTPQFPRETDRLYTVVDLSQPCSTSQNTAPADSPSLQSPQLQVSNAMQTPMSPSVYSRNTDGVSILPNDSVMSFGGPYESERTHQSGSAVILTSQSVRSYVIGTPSPTRRSSTRSSRDWKAWLSHEVSGIEAASQEDITIYQQYATRLAKEMHATTRAIRTSQTDSDDTTVIVPEPFDTSTPRAGSGNTTTVSTGQRSVKLSISESWVNCPQTVQEYDPTVAHESKKSPADRKQLEINLPAASVPTPTACRDGWPTTPSSSHIPGQSPIGTPTSARMNERFPFIDTKRQSSSNGSSRSCLSKSPTSSVGSSSKKSNGPPLSQTVESIVSVPIMATMSVGVQGATVKKSESALMSKENVTPPTNAGLKKPTISPLGLAQRPISQQPLSLAALSSKSIKIAHSSGSSAYASQLKRAPSSAESVVARPGLRVTIRPLSPEKLSRRPRSAFDLRQTPSPHPASESRRPALQSQASSRLLAGNGQQAINGGSCHGLDDAYQRGGSVTPGQRMAERYLKERRSATVLDRGVRKSTGKFVREDTPAFL